MEANQSEDNKKRTIKIRFLNLVLNVMETQNTMLMTIKMNKSQNHEDTGEKANDLDRKMKIRSQINKFCELISK